MRPLLVPELICSDLETSLAFYVGLLGFSVLYARPEHRFAYLDRGGAELMLEEYAPGARMLARSPFEQPFGRGINFQIRVEDVKSLHTAVVDAGLPTSCHSRSAGTAAITPRSAPTSSSCRTPTAI
jgi:catechol 2,3-dioxygenase-like lactoylglutathione lyase family enzyme